MVLGRVTGKDGAARPELAPKPGEATTQLEWTLCHPLHAYRPAQIPRRADS
jgi:hypothetical protein